MIFPIFFVAQIGLDVVLCHALVAVHGTLPEGQGHGLVQPFIQPLPQGHIGFFGQLHIPIGLDPAVELFHQFLLGGGEDTAEDGAAIVLVAHHKSTLPAAIAALSHQAVPGGSSFCHGNSPFLISSQHYHRFFRVASGKSNFFEYFLI